ncbi:MAG TPA: tetratricopeptide repeat protein, partial [Elusimicrobiota bacterium]|nr:tetratricopeptide repeat protein [Elusimicrobiota bacterium]
DKSQELQVKQKGSLCENERPLFLTVALILLTCHAWCDAPPTKSVAAMEAFNRGVQEFNAKQFNDAIPFFDQAISHDDEFAEAYYARGACRNYLKGYDGAIMDLGDAIRLKPELLDARALRGSIYFAEDQWDQALDDFNYVLSHNADDSITLLNRGVLYLKRENAPAALRDFKRFLVLRPNDAQAPQVRKIVAALSGAPAPRQSAGGGETAARRPPDAGTAARRRSETAQRLADALTLRSRPLSDTVARHVLRGERVEAVGDIHSAEPSAGSAPETNDNANP